MERFKIANHISELEFGENNIAVADVNGKKICVAGFRGQYFAFAYQCPHAGGILAEGHIDATGNVVCPVHRYKFSIINGYNSSGEGFFLKRWPVEIREDGVFLNLSF